MKNRTKKWLLVAGCFAICAVMVGLISNGFTNSPVQDDPMLMSDEVQEGVTVNPDNVNILDDKVPVTINTDTTAATDNNTGNGAVFRGTEQTIQPDVSRPVHDEETLRDPTRTPDGTPVSGPPVHMDHDSVQSPASIDRPVTDSGAGSGNNASGGSLPGFENAIDGGENTFIHVDSDGDINKQIGIMD